MTVEKIYPCICVTHKPGAMDRTDYGMPKMYVTNGGKAHQQWWGAYCPNCRRGIPIHEQKSAYLALMDWNYLQERLWVSDVVDTYSGLPREGQEQWKIEILEEMGWKFE